MPARTIEPPLGQLRPRPDPRDAQEWLDALTSGACAEAAFLQALPAFTRDAPDAAWDLLSLLDQYYRRGRISSESFHQLKSHLELQLLGPGPDVGISVPLPRKPDSLAPDHTVPIVASALRAAAGTSAAKQVLAPPAAAAAAIARRGIAAGDVLRGRYVIKGVLGRGGMGTVFEAVDQYRLDLPNAGQRVAIKVLHTAITERPELLTELRREFQYLQSLSHPNIVRVHEYDRDGDTAFFTMEYLSGRTLAQELSAHQEGLSRSQALSIIRDVGAALAHAHARRVVHGDLNPGNVFITDAGEVRVLDFGASRAQRCGPWAADLGPAEQTPIATPRFASCQLLEGETADVRDDIYALACIIYSLLTGKHPFEEHTAIEARTLHLTPARPSGISSQQWHALRAGLAFERDSRPSQVAQWLKPFGLASTADRLPAARGRRLVAAACVAGLAVLATGWWAAVNPHRSAIDDQLHTAPARSTPLPGRELAAQDAALRPVNAGDARAAPSSASVSTTPSTLSEPRSDSDPQGATSGAPPPQLAGAAQSVSLRPAESAMSAASAASSQEGTALPLAGSPVRSLKSSPGRSRIELAASAIEVPPTELTAHVVVRRTGSLQGDASFSWWTESGTAKPGQDFSPVAAHEEHIENGKSSVSLSIPLIADSTRQLPRSFYVMIAYPSDGASIGARNVAMVTIPPLQ